MWLFSQKHTPLVIALHDGAVWRARHFHFHHGQWHAEGAVEAAARNGKKLPKQILDFAVQSDTRRVRVLLSGDLHTVTMDLPQDAENEELHTALVYEAAEEIGIEAHMLRLASVSADRYQMGGESNMIVTAGFEAKLIEGFVQECERAGLEFDAVGSLEMAILARHARLDEEMRLLFLRRQTGLYAVPAFDSTPFMLSSMPFGCEPDETDAGKERRERTARRFDAHRILPVRVITCESISDEQRRTIHHLLGEDRPVEFLPFGEIMEDVLRHVAWAEVGGTAAGCAMIGSPPKPRDPHRAGTYLCLSIIVATALYVGLRMKSFDSGIRRAQKREAAWKELLGEREAAQAQLKSATVQYQQLLARQRLLEGRNCFPKALMPILDTLAFETPKYARITEIAELSDGSFEIKGVTRWQDGLRELAESFGNRGLERNWSSEAAVDNGEQRFTFTVNAGGTK